MTDDPHFIYFQTLDLYYSVVYNIKCASIYKICKIAHFALCLDLYWHCLYWHCYSPQYQEEKR